MKPLRCGRASLSTAQSSSQTSSCPRHLHHRPRPQYLCPPKCTLHPSCVTTHHTFHTSASLAASTPPVARPVRLKPTHQTPYRTITPAEHDRIKAARASIYKSYTPAEKAELTKRYNSEQLAAIEAGEAAIDPKDLGAQWRIRGDHVNTVRDIDPYGNSRILPTIDFSLNRIHDTGGDYLDRMARAVGGRESFLDYDPSPEGVLRDAMGRDMLENGVEGAVLDQMGEAEEDEEVEEGKTEDPTAKAKKDDYIDLSSEEIDRILNPNKEAPLTEQDKQDFRRDLMRMGRQELRETARSTQRDRFIQGKPHDSDTMTILSDVLKCRGLPMIPAPTKGQLTMKRHERIYGGSDEAPLIPKINDPSVRWGDENSVDPSEETDEDELRMKKLVEAVDISPQGVKDLKVTLLTGDFVANMTGLGKIYRWRIVACAGNGDGLLGLGMGGSTDRLEAAKIAGEKAIRNIVPIPRYERRTIYGEQRAKVGAVEVQLSARPPGFGLRVQERVHAIAVAAGLSDLSARVNRSRNKMNTCYAVWEALKKQRDPEELARARGLKMVDVRKVYYNGLAG